MKNLLKPAIWIGTAVVILGLAIAAWKKVMMQIGVYWLLENQPPILR